MDIAINTGSLSLDTLEALDRAAALGFGAVEVNLQQAEFRFDFHRKVDFAFYQRLAEAVKGRGLKVTSVHCLALSAPQAFSSQARGEILKASARVAATLQAPVLVAHPADLFTSYEALEQYFAGGAQAAPPVVEGYDECWGLLANRRIALALENISYWHRGVTVNRPERLARTLADLAIFGVLDVRRALSVEGSGDALTRWVDAVGPRILLLHAHDVSPAGEHQPPLAPDWSDLAPLLRRTGARACVLEVDARHGDDRIRESRRYFESLLSASNGPAEG